MTIPNIGMLPYAHWLAKISDVITIYSVGALSFLVYFQRSLWSWERYHWMVSLASLAAILIFSANGVYRSWRGAVRVGLVVRLFHGFITLGALIASYLYLTKAGHHFSRLWFVCWLSIAFVLSVLLRIAAYRFLSWLRLRGINMKTVALFGSYDTCMEVLRDVQNDRLSGFKITQIRFINHEKTTLPTIENIDVGHFSPSRDGLPPCHEIWLCLPLSAGDTITQLLQTLRHTTANIRYLPDFRGVRLINHQASYIVGHYALDISISPMRGGQRAAKWLLDKCLSLIALLILSPLLFLVGLWILCAAGRPIFYRQTRVGWNGKNFDMIKFRTMPINNETGGVTWGGAAKKETIPLGRLFRRLSIDELPQFWNVLKGDMSIVGPRPERPQFVEQFKDEISGYMQKHMVKAGMTGWAQVKGWRGDTDLQQRINHDLWYIENWSVWLDLKILFLTISRIFNDSSAS